MEPATFAPERDGLRVATATTPSNRLSSNSPAMTLSTPPPSSVRPRNARSVCRNRLIQHQRCVVIWGATHRWCTTPKAPCPRTSKHPKAPPMKKHVVSLLEQLAAIGVRSAPGNACSFDDPLTLCVAAKRWVSRRPSTTFRWDGGSRGGGVGTVVAAALVAAALVAAGCSSAGFYSKNTPTLKCNSSIS